MGGAGVGTGAGAGVGTAPVPLVDLAVQHRQVAAEVAEGFERVMASGAFIQGEDVTRFEEDFAAYCQTRHCVGVANGTDAIELGLRALGVGPGDEVVVPANTFVATAEAVVRTGADLAFADCDPSTLLIDPRRVAEQIGPRTRAVVAVHLYGQVGPMDELAALTTRAGISLVEDAAQAQGARHHGRPAGSFGVFAATSFYPGKNLGAYGDAGAVLTGSDEVARALRALRNHGGERRYEHSVLGFNSRLDTLQAVVLRAKLRRLEGWNAERRRAASRYAELLAGVPGVSVPSTAPGNEHAWHLYVVQVDNRDRVLAALNGAGIGAGIHYPVPVHLLPPFRGTGPGPGAMPVAEAAAGRILSLPLFPGITEAQQERVVEVLRQALAEAVG